MYQECGICLEPTYPVSSPFKAATAPTSSSNVPFGFRVAGCAHVYCIGCLQSYFSTTLSSGKGDAVVFPIRCPGVRPPFLLQVLA